MVQHLGRATYQEEAVYKDIKEKGRKRVARVVVVPQADLHRCYDGCVEEEETTASELA